jgi:hypothetical protein
MLLSLASRIYVVFTFSCHSYLHICEQLFVFLTQLRRASLPQKQKGKTTQLCRARLRNTRLTHCVCCVSESACVCVCVCVCVYVCVRERERERERERQRERTCERELSERKWNHERQRGRACLYVCLYVCHVSLSCRPSPSPRYERNSHTIVCTHRHTQTHTCHVSLSRCTSRRCERNSETVVCTDCLCVSVPIEGRM